MLQKEEDLHMLSLWGLWGFGGLCEDIEMLILAFILIVSPVSISTSAYV